jgi:hypothetical protein
LERSSRNSGTDSVAREMIEVRPVALNAVAGEDFLLSEVSQKFVVLADLPVSKRFVKQLEGTGKCTQELASKIGSDQKGDPAMGVKWGRQVCPEWAQIVANKEDLGQSLVRESRRFQRLQGRGQMVCNQPLRDRLEAAHGKPDFVPDPPQNASMIFPFGCSTKRERSVA